MYSVKTKQADVCLSSVTPATPNFVLLPFIYFDFSIFYKAGEFHLSPTYFIDGLSTQMWIFIWSFFVLFSFGLLISVKTYQKFFKYRSVSISDVVMYEMNFVSNQSHVLPTNDYEKFLSWRIQMICQSVFNIIIACAFSTFILALLSIKTTDKQFHSLDDFVTKRTHVICNDPTGGTMDFFTNLKVSFGNLYYEVKPEFKGILNEKACGKLLNETNDELLCKLDNLALVASPDEFLE